MKLSVFFKINYLKKKSEVEDRIWLYKTQQKLIIERKEKQRTWPLNMFDYKIVCVLHFFYLNSGESDEHVASIIYATMVKQWLSMQQYTA